MSEQAVAPQPEQNIEMLRYKEELAEKLGLPSPYGMNLLKQLSGDLVASGFVPKHFANNPMAVYLAAMRGREMGLDPMESILETFWAAPGNRLGMYAAKMLDIMHRNGVKSKFVEHTNKRCEILFTPPGGHEPYTASFNIEEAAAAGLIKPGSNWTLWPSDMCMWRAVSRGWRALLGTFKGGAYLYSKEELEDLPSEDGAPGTPVIQVEREEYRVERVEPQAPPKPGPNPEPKVEPAPAQPKPETPPPPREAPVQSEQPPTQDSQAQTPSLADQVKAEMAELKEVIGGPPNSAARKLNDALRNYFGIRGDLKSEGPRDPQVYLDALAKLRQVPIESLRVNPVEAGLIARTMGDELEAIFSVCEWKQPTRMAARAVMKAYGLSTEEFIDYLEDTTLSLGELDDEDALAFFGLAQFTREAGRLILLSQTCGVSPHNLINSMEESLKDPFHTVTPKVIDKAIEAMEQKYALAPTQEKDDEAQGGLPFD